MRKKQLKKILVGIEVPHERRQPALRRAAQLAGKSGARLVLFHSAYSPYVVGAKPYYSPMEKGVKEALAEREEGLRKLARPLERRGLKVEVKAVWDYPAHEGIVREVLRSKPDLVVAESHRRGIGARLVLTNTDWQLIRLCPAPLLFVKKKTAWRAARVLAAIDPMHAYARPSRLDERILEAAASVADASDGRVDVVHVYMPPSVYLPGIHGESAVFYDPKFEREYRNEVRKAVQKATAGMKLPAGRVHVEPGTPQTVLPEIAKRLRADVLVMGAVSRRGLKRLFIGNTAERVIDDVTCDVLVVKPFGFKTPVPPRSPLARPRL